MIPQLIFILLTLSSIYRNFKNNFEIKRTQFDNKWLNENRWFTFLLSHIILLGLLAWGGFFNVFFN